MENITKYSNIRTFKFSLDQLFSLDSVKSRKEEVEDLVNNYKSKNIISSLLVEYSYYIYSQRYLYLQKLIVLNDDATYSQVVIVLWEPIHGAKITKDASNNIIVVDSIWESQITFSNISEKSKNFHLRNFKNNYIEDVEQVNHGNNFFHYPTNDHAVYIKYNKFIGVCNIRSMFDKIRPEYNNRDNYILTLDIKDWLEYDFEQIYIHNRSLLGVKGSLIKELPVSEIFENRQLFEDIMKTEVIGKFSGWGNLNSYNVYIDKGILNIYHSYDYYQGDNSRDYAVINKILLTDLMMYNESVKKQ